MSVEEAKKIAKLECALEFCKKQSVLEQYVSDEKWKHFDIAVGAIEKQIPKKPIGRHTSYKCPICDRRVRSGKGSSSFGVDYFCQRCGQALDWSDTE